jgi:hypothetical protein
MSEQQPRKHHTRNTELDTAKINSAEGSTQNNDQAQN